MGVIRPVLFGMRVCRPVNSGTSDKARLAYSCCRRGQRGAGRIRPAFEGLNRLSRAESRQARAQFAQIVNAGISVVAADDGREYNRERLKAQAIVSSCTKAASAVPATCTRRPYRKRFRAPWDSINTACGHCRETNPWVRVIEFERKKEPQQ